MLLLTSIACLLLAGCSAVPSTIPDIVIKDNFFKHGTLIYTGQHDIVRIFVPFKQFHFEDKFQDGSRSSSSSSSSSSSEEIEHQYLLFFVEGDYVNDEVINKGLYAYKNGKATKILENGRDAVATQTKKIYLGAEDGIYEYDNATNTAVKHGTVTDSINHFAFSNKTNAIYYLTDDNEVYKLSEDATSSAKVPSLTDVQELAFGYEGNLYYYNSKKEFYVVDIEASGDPMIIPGLPATLNKPVLMAPFFALRYGVILYVDELVYHLGYTEVEKLPFKIEVNLTAQAPQPTLIQFYGKDKKIYEFNIVAIVMSDVIEQLRGVSYEFKDFVTGIKKSAF